MKIHIEKDPTHNLWWVHMGLCAVRLRSLAEAESFVERLNSRINAPHSLGAFGNSSPSPEPLSNSQPFNKHAAPNLAKDLTHA